MYTRAQKESSSVSATSIHKKSNGSAGSHSFSVQRQPEINSSQEKHIPSYSRNTADSLITNVMRSMAAREQGEEAQGHKDQQESGAASVAQVVMPKPELPIAPVASVSQPLGEMGIQRQCSACEQAMEDGKDSDEMSSVAGVQTKLTVGAVGDKYEQEADRVAAQVMSMSVAPDHSPQVQRFGEEDNPVQRWSLAQSITPVVQRQVDEQVQMQALVQRAFQAGGNQASGDLESRLNASKGGGSALAPEVRAFMEPRFGADFSAVRVHTGSEAVQMNRELGAQAFAHGRDVYFGAGKSPGNNELTAHELTHVVQQTGRIQPKHIPDKSQNKNEHEVRTSPVTQFIQTAYEVCQEESEQLMSKPNSSIDLLPSTYSAQDVVQRYSHEDCSENDLRTKVWPADWLARQMTFKAINVLSTTSSDPRVQAILAKYFMTRTPNISTIISIYRTIQSKFSANDYTYECEDECDDGGLGYVYAIWSDVHLCMNILRSWSSQLIARTIVHEFSHNYAGTDDKSYCKSGACPPGLSIAGALDNADSYACFAYDLWLSGI
jgi:hypothetical protein